MKMEINFEQKRKFFVLLPLLMLIFSICFLIYNYTQKGEFFEKSIELKGGNLIEINTKTPLDTIYLERELSKKFGFVSIRSLKGFNIYTTMIEVESYIEPEDVLKELQNLGVNTERNSIKKIGSSLGSSFWVQAQEGIIVAFIFMFIIIFIIFRNFMPSITVTLCSAADILFALAMSQLLGIKISLAGVAALLTIIAYSADSDVLLATRLFKGEGKLWDRYKSALKTGLTIASIAISVLIVLLLFGLNPVLFQISSILLFGLIADVINSWLGSGGILLWYCERRGI